MQLYQPHKGDPALPLLLRLDVLHDPTETSTEDSDENEP